MIVQKFNGQDLKNLRNIYKQMSFSTYKICHVVVTYMRSSLIWVAQPNHVAENKVFA